MADYYRERNMAAVIFTVDDEAGMGRRRLGNDEVLDAAEANPTCCSRLRRSTRTRASSASARRAS